MPADAGRVRVAEAGACRGAGAGWRGSGAGRVCFAKRMCRFPQLQYLNHFRNCVFSRGRVVLGMTESVEELDPVRGPAVETSLQLVQGVSPAPAYATTPSTTWPPRVGPHHPDRPQLFSRGSPSLLTGSPGASPKRVLPSPVVQHFQPISSQVTPRARAQLAWGHQAETSSLKHSRL